MESDKQRSIRRVMSGWLTEQINSCGNTNINPKLSGILKDGVGTKVRGFVIESLNRIDLRLSDLNNSMKGDRYSINTDRELVKFYMKGGNAFECIIDPNGLGATQLGGGNSDWDTQIVIDPWAPQPIIDTLYGLVEDIVLDEFGTLSINIAEAIKSYVDGQAQNPQLTFSASVLKSWDDQNTDLKGKNFSRYELSLDDPQTLRRVYDHDRIGLWMNDRKPLTNKSSDAKLVPGMLFNDAINPFVLYRLGYTWHAETGAGKDLGDNVVFDGDITKPILMELIDVTIPRINTIEAVTVWEELIHDEIVITKPQIKVDVNAYNQSVDTASTTTTANLPLPSLEYHISELLTMLSEIADGSSKHTDKMVKRFDRLKTIWDRQEALRNKMKKKMAAMIGVPDITTLEVEPQERVDALIEEVKNEEQRTLFGLNDAAINITYELIRSMMYYVEKISKEHSNMFTNSGAISKASLIQASAGRKQMNILLKQLIERCALPPVINAAYSDDLALLDFLLENGYLDISKIGFSGVFQSVAIRIADYDQLKIRTAKIASLLTTKTKTCIYKMYNTPRATRISYESLLIVMVNGKAETFMTLTTASSSEVPFVADPVDGRLKYNPISEIANQRKVAAALIEDYIIRTAMSRQYEAIGEIVPIPST